MVRELLIKKNQYRMLAALKFCFKTCVAMKFVDDDDDDDEGCHDSRKKVCKKRTLQN